MTDRWMQRHRDAPMPYQDWRAFPADAIVQVKNIHGDSNIGPAGKFWWGYEEELGGIGGGVIIAARRLDTPKGAKP